MSFTTTAATRPSFAETSLVGFDRVLNMLDELQTQPRSHFPPYSVWKLEPEQDGSRSFIIELAVAGYARDELAVERDGLTLTVSSAGSSRTYKGEAIQRGIACRQFTTKFHVDEALEIIDVKLADGLLTIYMVKPPEKKVASKRLEIR
jgi:molecular chaperone IbpA